MMNALQTQNRPHLGRPLSLLASGAFVIFCLVLAYSSARFTGIFASMFRQLEVEIPWPTRLLLANGTWILPVLFIALAALTLVKEFLASHPRRKLALTKGTFFVALLIVSVVIVLYLPLLTMAWRLAKTK